MTWVAFGILACAGALGLLMLAQRTRASNRQLRERIVEVERAAANERTTLRSRTTQLEESIERARAERQKINTRFKERTRIINENRAGVQEAKDRTGALRSQVNERHAVNAKVLQELRSKNIERGRSLTATRIEVQKLRDRLHQREIPTGAALPEDDNLGAANLNDAARQLPHIKAARERLAEVAEATAPTDVRRHGTTEIDLTKLLPVHGPQVSIVVTSFNDGEYLQDCLRSVRQQTFVEFECIVVDDASTDDSIAIATEMASDDDRFTVIVHAKNAGPSAARNTGLAKARAPFIAFLDSDDLLLAESLEQRLFTLLQMRRPEVAGVFSGIEHRGADITLDSLPSHLPWKPPKRADLFSTKGECPFNLHAPLLRTDLLHRAGGFDESMRVGAEDWELWLRLMRNGFSFEPCTATLGIYRQKPQSLVRSHPAEHLAASSELLASVQLPAAPATRMSNAPHFYQDPLSSYDNDLLLAKRAFQYLSLAALTNDPAQLSAAIEQMPKKLEVAFRDDLNRRAQIFAGLRRGLGLSADDFAHVLPEANVVRDNLETLAHAAQEEPPPPLAFPAPSKQEANDPLQLFYWQAAEGGQGAGNFGDELSPLLVALASGRSVQRAEVEDCELIALGSILDLTVDRANQRPAIWGSGFIRAGGLTGAGLNIHAVRGALTNERCGSVGAIGDPALLSRYLEFESIGEHRVGLLPHYVDWALPIVQQFRAEVDGVVVIDPLDSPENVLGLIAGCDVLFSSSLHGLICADSLETPNAWIELSDNVVGSGYKFADYYSCFEITPTPIRPRGPEDLIVHIDDIREAYDRPNIERLCAGLLDAFPRHI